MLTGEIKKILAGVLKQVVSEHQERKAKLTDEDVKKFMEIRPLKAFGLN